MYALLNRIEKPEDVKALTVRELEQLASELRHFIIDTVSQNGGHLAPNLGTVELTLALYSVFSFPGDKLVWDVGHQAYTHKILTGRRDAFKTLRKKGGITGFPNRSESVYDAFGVGHASTSISAALGMALARDAKGEKNQVIAVIGDGALTGGESFEALNNAGDLGTKLIVILNDNEMSIDANVGAMSEYLSRIRIAPQYARAKRDMGSLLMSIPHIGDKVYKTASHLKDGVRSVLVPGSLFEEMGFHYIGPIDGHNIGLLEEVLASAKEMEGPVLIHIHTVKGKGYKPAEQAPEKFHGVGCFDPSTGKSAKKAGCAPSYTSVFSKALIDLAKDRPDILAITAAMPSGTGLKAFGQAYPKRFFDVGIAEEHAMTLAAGMAAAGMHPVIALYSTFAQRAYDQLIHDVCLQNLPVTLCLDRAGLVGEDGPTHHGVFDLSYLRQMPNMCVMAPKDEEELRHMLATAIAIEGPAAVRYPRGAGLGVPLTDSLETLPVGKAEVLQEEGDIAFLAVGTMVEKAKEAAAILKEEGIEAAVVNMRFIKPLDTELLGEMARTKKLLITAEENVLAGGFGSAVAEYLADHGIEVPLLRFGIPDRFIEQGTRRELLSLCGLQPDEMAERIRERLSQMDENA
ncbi:MAG: 1-deoxy-D-xylulose-5-phosphate synthase [Mitsuokella jalaludinii]|uniref:1-deoxy-D-xylulose-5-phosphate synthase n=1 Tax=Mitsuokella jalaludinii TaxID=187979 RepID=UPI00242A33E8|nr:1-deoxy-D-xylulose-5-phosphate synthase [Mitsuokella jalaludinii]MDD7745130.1 1-deoxy-D-xylulose-5-phosphate synthase [Mitsuokella jalaludinii]